MRRLHALASNLPPESAFHRFGRDEHGWSHADYQRATLAVVVDQSTRRLFALLAAAHTPKGKTAPRADWPAVNLFPDELVAELKQRPRFDRAAIRRGFEQAAPRTPGR